MSPGMPRIGRTSNTADLICLSHLRWHFVFQRPQHLMTRCARERRVFFVEEPILEPGITPRLNVEPTDSVIIVVPHLPEDLDSGARDAALRQLMDELIA